MNSIETEIKTEIELEWCWTSIDPKEIAPNSILIFKFLSLDQRKEEAYDFCKKLISFLPSGVNIHIIDSKEDMFIVPPQSLQSFVDAMKNK